MISEENILQTDFERKIYCKEIPVIQMALYVREKRITGGLVEKFLTQTKSLTPRLQSQMVGSNKTIAFLPFSLTSPSTFRKRSLPSSTVDAIISNQAFSHDRYEIKSNQRSSRRLEVMGACAGKELSPSPLRSFSLPLKARSPKTNRAKLIATCIAFLEQYVGSPHQPSLGLQVFLYDRCNIFLGLSYSKENHYTFLNSLRKDDVEAQDEFTLKVMERTRVTCY